MENKNGDVSKKVRREIIAGFENIKTKVINNGCCYGCGVCAAICPMGVIKLQLSEEGFYVPVAVNEKKCIKCNLCEKVCSYVNSGLARVPSGIRGYVAYSNTEDVRKSCSSGGVGFEIARLLIEKGYQACGVRYSGSRNRAEHFIAKTVKEFEPSKGSKYLQSYTVDSFRKLLSNCGKWVVFGTPCQIDSLARFIKLKKMEDRFVLVDFFCHGVPSYYLWNSYLNFNKQKYNLNDINHVIFRDKRKGSGKHSWTISFQSGGKEIVSSLLEDKDLFYKLFLGNFCLNAACYDSCKFKNLQSSSDIRIGDLWSKDYSQCEQGLSAVLANTHKGHDILEGLNGLCVVKEEALETVCNGQMIDAIKKPLIREKVFNALLKNKPLNKIYLEIVIVEKVKRMVNKLLKIIKGEVL